MWDQEMLDCLFDDNYFFYYHFIFMKYFIALFNI